MGTRGWRWEGRGGWGNGVIKDSDWFNKARRSAIGGFPCRSFSFNRKKKTKTQRQWTLKGQLT